MKKLFLFVLCTPFLLASTCENDDNQIVCTQDFVYGLNVVVLDATTGNPLVEGVTVEATDDGYHENLHLIPGLEYSFAGAGERTGTYIITITKEGYQTYTSSPIVVTANVCHVIPQSLTVDLHSN
ncbi:carboxypeptidase-like regulatory domain-containing protein [Flavobacterium sp.]|uniref:carboxypeptidase-like regulatory domain-containing protein n=1 Tax=Flavobacterium sp. TaxID=239 RepID=UPI0025CF29B9|nr:carboxypeptidase-like regulatory domain-containing protein [Flavobacterium sp.]